MGERARIFGVVASLLVLTLGPAAGPASAAPAPGPERCGDPGPIAWDRLSNPIVSDPTRSLKDASLWRTDGRWHVLASDIAPAGRFRIGHRSSADLTGFAEEVVHDEPAFGGLASPHIVPAPSGGLVVTYNSHTTDAGGAEEKLYVADGGGLAGIDERRRIAVTGRDAAEDRLIDAALAFTPIGPTLTYKYVQTFEIAYSPSGDLSGPYEIIGAPPVDDLGGEGVENYQLVPLDGRWHLLATRIPSIPEQVERGFRTAVGLGVDGPRHRTLLFPLAGDPATPAGWLEWATPAELVVPEEEWNSPQDASSDYERQNAASLCDRRAIDGYAYLLYAGSTQLASHAGRGHAALGIARSRDLVSWEVPTGGNAAAPAPPVAAPGPSSAPATEPELPATGGRSGIPWLLALAAGGAWLLRRRVAP